MLIIGVIVGVVIILGAFSEGEQSAIAAMAGAGMCVLVLIALLACAVMSAVL